MPRDQPRSGPWPLGKPFLQRYHTEFYHFYAEGASGMAPESLGPVYCHQMCSNHSYQFRCNAGIQAVVGEMAIAFHLRPGQPGVGRTRRTLQPMMFGGSGLFPPTIAVGSWAMGRGPAGAASAFV